MKIKIKHIETKTNEKDEFDVTDTYKVTDNDKEFLVTFKRHMYGCSLGLAGQKGILYTDHENDKVCLQVFDIGRDCGLKIESDDPVEGLSTLAIRGVIFADRKKETREITLTTGSGGSVNDRPAMSIDGIIVETQF